MKDPFFKLGVALGIFLLALPFILFATAIGVAIHFICKHW